MSPAFAPHALFRLRSDHKALAGALAAGAALGTVTSLAAGRGIAVVAAVVLLAQLSVAALAMIRDAYAKIAALRSELEAAKAERVVVIDAGAVDVESVPPVRNFSRPPPIPQAA